VRLAGDETPEYDAPTPQQTASDELQGLGIRAAAAGGLLPRTSAHRPAESMPKSARRRRRRPVEDLRRSDGTNRARNPPKLSELTRPSATSSARPSSACEGSSAVPSTISSKNEAPCALR